MLTEDELRQRLDALAEPLERRLAFAALLTDALEELGYLPPIVVGGHAVEFYTSGGYTTMDLDLVASSDGLDRVLSLWRFQRLGRHWVHEELALAVEASGSRLEGERDRTTEVTILGSRAYVMGLEDLIIDRVCAYVTWGSEADGRWASILLELHKARIDREYLCRRAETYGIAGQIDHLLESGTL